MRSGAPGGQLPALVLRGLVKRFAGQPAVDGVELAVGEGEFVTLLGPSGSGKTTTLRLIAGLLEPDEGSIEIGGRDVTGVPVHRRDLGMVFQSYALFPHMTAAQNVAFPLAMRGVGRAETGRRVGEALDLVHLGGLGERYPRQLSGGQQQRVALARAVVFGPQLLLMDEPLGALDRRLREALQLEILRVSRQIGAAVVYVTHDQDEALALSDRICVLRHGRVEQTATGETLYERPASLFVARFVGDSNVVRGTLEADPGAAPSLVANGRRLRLADGAAADAGLTTGQPAALVIRPEWISLARRGPAAEQAGDGLNVVDAVVAEVLYLGGWRKVALELGGGQSLIARLSPEVAADWRPGDELVASWPVERGLLLGGDDAPP